MVHASSVRGCGQHASKGLLGYRSEIDHGEAVGGQGGVKTLQGDTALGMDISFFRIDLCDSRKEGRQMQKYVYRCLETRQRRTQKKTGLG